MPTATSTSRKDLFSRLGDVFHVTGKKDRMPTSPVPHLLTSNIPPSEEERRIIEAAITHARMQAESLRDELQGSSATKMDTMHRRMQETLSMTETFIERHQSILSILHSLPDEILALIFTHCLPALKSRTWGYRTWGYNPSFRLSQVCRRWRAIALADSRLWTILGDVHLTVKTAKVTSTYPQFIEDLLCRSKNMDLWIFVYCPPHEVLPMGNVHPVVNVLLKHERRWRVLGIEASVRTVKSICEPSSDTMDIATSSPLNSAPLNYLSLPRLQKLDLDIKTYNQGNQIVGFANAPALTEVRIAGTYPLIKLPMHQLRVYSQATSGGQDIDGPVKEVIKLASDLERLELIGEQQTVALNKNTTVDNLKVLHLRLDDTRQNEGEGVLDNLILPKLEELKIASYSLHVPRSLTAFVERTLAVAPSLPLRKVTLRQIHPPAGTLVEFLKLTPNLEELVVEFPAATQVLELLDATKAEDPLEWIPKLRSLVVYTYPKNVDESEDEINHLAQAMLAHKPNPIKAQNFRLIFPTRDSAHHGQVTLNGWGKSSADDLQLSKCDALLTLLRSFRNVLEVNIPELKADRFMLRLHERPPPKRKHDLGFSKRLDAILSEVDALVLAQTDVPVLYVSKLHLCLHRLSKLCERDIYGDQKHNFRGRAQGIVKKWCGLFAVDLRESGTRWALLGTRSLVYVPEDDPIRMSERVLDIVLGMYDCSDHEDSTWSDHV